MNDDLTSTDLELYDIIYTLHIYIYLYVLYSIDILLPILEKNLDLCPRRLELFLVPVEMALSCSLAFFVTAYPRVL